MRQGGHYGRHAGLHEAREHVAVNPVDVADEAVVNVLDGPFVRAYHVAVGSGQTYCVDVCRLQARHDVLVHQSAVDHRRHFEHAAVGDAPPAYHAALYAEARGHCRCAAAAAVYEHLAPAYRSKGGKQAAEPGLIFNYGPAHLDYC